VREKRHPGKQPKCLGITRSEALATTCSRDECHHPSGWGRAPIRARESAQPARTSSSMASALSSLVPSASASSLTRI
jgi:hypothetical protein